MTPSPCPFRASLKIAISFSDLHRYLSKQFLESIHIKRSASDTWIDDGGQNLEYLISFLYFFSFLD